MPLYYSLAEYTRYRERVGAETYIDVTRRTDPARVPAVWEHLREVVEAYGAPWVVQLWTKDPIGTVRLGGDLLRRLVDAGTTLTAQLTVTGLAGSVWEPLVPPNGLGAASELAALLGGWQHITWRYDPIIPTVHTAERFRELAEHAADLGIRRGVVNFIAPPGRYRRVDRRLSSLLPGWEQGMPGYDANWRRATAAELLALAQDRGLALACCAENAALGDPSSPAWLPGMGRAACGDYAWFCQLAGCAPNPRPQRGSRRGCGCASYFDVGLYGCWSRCHQCAYCYAG